MRIVTIYDGVLAGRNSKQARADSLKCPGCLVPSICCLAGDGPPSLEKLNLALGDFLDSYLAGSDQLFIAGHPIAAVVLGKIKSLIRAVNDIGGGIVRAQRADA